MTNDIWTIKCFVCSKYHLKSWIKFFLPLGAWYSWSINKRKPKHMGRPSHDHANSKTLSFTCNIQQTGITFIQIQTQKQTQTNKCSHASNIAWSIQIQFFECFLCTKRSIFWVIATFILSGSSTGELILQRWIQKCQYSHISPGEVFVNSKSRLGTNSNLRSFW